MRWPGAQTMLLTATLLGVASGCGPSGGTPPSSHVQTVLLRGATATGLSLAEIARVDLTISGPGISSPITTELGRGTTNAWIGTVTGIPAGPARLFEAEARDTGGQVLYEGRAVSDVPAGSDVQLVLLLQDPPPPPDSGAPQISSIEVSPGQVAPSASVDVRVVASSGAGDTLSYGWESRCPGALDDGRFTDPTAASTRWSAPSDQPVTCVFSVRVSGSGGSSVTVYVTVQVSS
jgi:hypothetical protein